MTGAATLRVLLTGATAMGCLVAALFFLKFWQRSRDVLFVYFATAFAILAANWTVLAFLDPASEVQSLYYLMRLVAFVLIIIAIWHKNRAPA
jgi:hypothetical protein